MNENCIIDRNRFVKKVSAVILAAGQSSRMKGPIKKPYLNLNGLPLVSYSLKTFDKCSHIDTIYLAISRSDINLCKKYVIDRMNLSRKINLTVGGPTRQASVLNVLETMKSRGENGKNIVLIHDAARPFLTEKLILKCIKAVKNTGACIPMIPINDSLKKFSNQKKGVITSITRKNTWLAQTPQSFYYDLILAAHYKAKKEKFEGTDDSSIAENANIDVTAVEGHTFNIKITRKTDLVLAKAIAKNISY